MKLLVFCFVCCLSAVCVAIEEQQQDNLQTGPTLPAIQTQNLKDRSVFFPFNGGYYNYFKPYYGGYYGGYGMKWPFYPNYGYNYGYNYGFNHPMYYGYGHGYPFSYGYGHPHHGY